MLDFQIPILMYHEVTRKNKIQQIKRTHRSYIVTVQQFKEQMKWLAEAGFTTISLYDVLPILQNKNSYTLPSRPIIITFDDGYAGNHEFALPILEECGFTATFFIIVNQIGTHYMMQWTQLKELVATNMSIQSHTMNHAILKQLDRQAIFNELIESKHILQNSLQTSIDFVSLPHGGYNNLYKEAAIEAEYLGGCTSELGFISPNHDPFYLNRIVVKSKYNLEEFKQLTESNTRFLNRVLFRRKYKDLIYKILGAKYYNQLYRLLYCITE